jgi:CMP-N,N'-diacetyllegionaminic acid synthase
MKKKNILAVIPARKGSKSIKNKNIKNFAGQPLIAWTIDQALNSKASRVIVSTDSLEIKKISEDYGAEVPFLRKKSLSNDHVSIEPVIRDVLFFLKQNNDYVPDAVILLMPTSPFRKIEDINKAILEFKKNDCTSVISVTKAEANQNPYWMLKIKNKKVILATGENLSKIRGRRQDLPDIFIRNDFVYIFHPNNLFRGNKGLYGSNPKLMVISSSRDDIDINTEKDWKIAEYLFKSGKISN